MTGTSDGDDTDVRRELYAADPDRFVAMRAERAKAAKRDGDPARAKRIAALRKPTTSASIVNRHVLADPSVPDRLAGIGDRLRAAQGSRDGIDRELLRELSAERRSLVRDTSNAALHAFGPSAGSAIRDEVVATFDAAVADPEVNAALGELVHARAWSGFGAVADAPALTVVSGGRTQPRSSEQRPPARRPGGRGRSASAAEQKPSDAEQKLSGAEQELSAAERDLSAALEAQRHAADLVAGLDQQLADLRERLRAAERDATGARDAVRDARTRRRSAKAARDRARKAT